ncbi:MAG: type IX secretion system protein PorQ [Bacteroidia bacterium]
MVRKNILICALSIVTLNAFSQIGGSKTYEFLTLAPAVPRTIALGGASIGIKDDDFGNTLQNPALLSNAASNNAVFLGTGNFHKGDVKYQMASFGKTLNERNHFAFAIQAVAYGLIDQRDEYGNDLGNIRANDYSFNLMYARDLDSCWTLGVNAKTIYSQFGQYKSIGNALDAGLTYHKPNGRFAMTGLLKNMGYQWKSYTGKTKEKIPYDVQFGISYRVPKAPFRLIGMYDYLNKWDLTYTDPNNPPATEDPFTHIPYKKHPAKTYMNKLGRHVIPALEILITKNFNLRVAYNYRRRQEMILTDKQGVAGFSFGVGLRITCVQISWACAQYTPGFWQNYFSLSTKVSEYQDFKKRRQERKEAKAKEAS